MSDVVNDRAATADTTRRVMKVGITPIALTYVTFALAVAIGVAAIFSPAEEAITRIVIGVVLALALDPLVRALQRRGLGRRAAATVVGLAVVVIALALVV